MEHQCKKCKQIKKASEFYAVKESKFGIDTSHCKECRKESERKKWKKFCPDERKKILKRMRKYSKKHFQLNKKRYADNTEKLRKKYPEKFHARQTLKNAVASGKVKKLPCIECGEIKVHGHHEDYSKPLKVTWLCQKHHSELHSKKFFNKSAL